MSRHARTTVIRIDFLKWLYKNYGATINVRLVDLLSGFKTSEGNQVWTSVHSVWRTIQFFDEMGWINIRCRAGRAQSYYIKRETIKTIIMNE